MKVIRKWKRRKPGVYAWRTDRHQRRGREWGYVGESVNIGMRDRCHLGSCSHKSCTRKDWTDLLPVRYTIIRLPWWLGFKWVLRPLETIVMRLLLPRYNWAKNGWNPRRVPPSIQRLQRAQRDRGAVVRRGRALTLDAVIRFAGVLLILAGLSGYLLGR